MYIGSCCVRTWSKDQGLIATSSGEAELYAANYGAAQGLGLKTTLSDWGMPMELVIEVDANATIGMLHRQGIGRLRHIEVQDLWLQQEVKKGRVRLRKVAGWKNTADLGTKPLASDGIKALMVRMGFAIPTK